MRKSILFLLAFAFCIFTSPLLRAQDLNPNGNPPVEIQDPDPNPSWDYIPSEDVSKLLVPYVWGRVPESEQSLTDAVRDMERLGTKKIRIYMGPNFTYPEQVIAADTPLDIRMWDVQYWIAFNRNERIYITAYDAVSNLYPKVYNPMSLANLFQHRAEVKVSRFRPLGQLNADQFKQVTENRKAEFHRFCYNLSWIDKEFRIMNWEAGNDAIDPSLWESRFVPYEQARVTGCLEGREEARVAKAPAKVLIGFEGIYVPGFAGHPSDFVEIGAKLVGVDFWSYSAWRSIGWQDNLADVIWPFRAGIRLIKKFMANHPGLPQRLVIGEFGNNWLIHPDLLRVEAMVRIAREEKVEDLIFWNGYHQENERDEWGRLTGYGIFNPDRSYTDQGEEFRKWLERGITPKLFQ